MNQIYYVLGFVSGLMLTIQVGVNTTLRTRLGSPILAATVSFAVGLVGLVGYFVLSRATLPDRTVLNSIPAWAWLGGLLGAFYVATAVIVGPRLGAAALLALIVLGQLCASLCLDHFGWLGFPQHPISAIRLVGAGLLFGGVLLMTR